MQKEGQAGEPCHQYPHHHHHHRHHADESEVFKNKALAASRRRKIWARLVYVLLVFLAILVSMGVFYAYCID